MTMTKLIELWRDNKSFLIFLTLMFMFRSAIADWSTVPTGSMKPTILEGDRIAINKIAYDLRIPFTHISLMKTGEPERGDIAVFDSAVADKRLVKRVIGLPGDVISMHNNQLMINGVALNYSEKTSSTTTYIDKQEKLGNTLHTVRISDQRNHAFANFIAVIVPDGQYLMMGDNRDNSADSRVIGFVPRAEIVGRSRSVIMSVNYDNYYLPRADRWMKKL